MSNDPRPIDLLLIPLGLYAMAMQILIMGAPRPVTREQLGRRGAPGDRAGADLR